MTKSVAPPPLTSLSHGGGCGCKIAPGTLADLLRGVPAGVLPRELLVGRETADDAAVYQINPAQAVVATTDFFMPIVDDPHAFGRIAATNALSDIYAMGATPLFALAIVAMPINVLPRAVIQAILAGGEAACASAGIPVAGGHSIDSVEPIYGLAAMGTVAPDRLMRNSTGRLHDRLVLGKPLGVGIYAAALRKGRLDEASYEVLLESTTRLNRAGPGLAAIAGVHAMTDVTGFGLLGHLLEMCRGAGVGARLRAAQVPVFANAYNLAESGFVTGASARNWESYGQSVEFGGHSGPVLKAVLTDPQTSGGLLVSCDERALPAVLAEFARHGTSDARVIGELVAGPARVVVE
jgi:selenide,water dikinase